MGESNREVSEDENEDDLVCPLCMETLDETDRNMYPCSCGYQVCLWCLHYIRNTMGNKCPACRRDYDEANIKYKSKPRSLADANDTAAGTSSRLSTAKKKKPLDKDPNNTSSVCSVGASGNVQSENDNQVGATSAGVAADGKATTPMDPSRIESLKDVRVIQRNLVYVVGIPARFAKKEVLRRQEHFGQYGRIQHMAINKSLTYNSHWGGPSFTAYITYSKKSEAAAAISGIDGSQLDNKLLRASYGTTKYCSYFLKGAKCCNVDCFYLHQFGDERDRFNKETMKQQMVNVCNGIEVKKNANVAGAGAAASGTGGGGAASTSTSTGTAGAAALFSGLNAASARACGTPGAATATAAAKVGAGMSFANMAAVASSSARDDKRRQSFDAKPRRQFPIQGVGTAGSPTSLGSDGIAATAGAGDLATWAKLTQASAAAVAANIAAGTVAGGVAGGIGNTGLFTNTFATAFGGGGNVGAAFASSSSARQPLGGGLEHKMYSPAMATTFASGSSRGAAAATSASASARDATVRSFENLEINNFYNGQFGMLPASLQGAAAAVAATSSSSGTSSALAASPGPLGIQAHFTASSNAPNACTFTEPLSVQIHRYNRLEPMFMVEEYHNDTGAEDLGIKCTRLVGASNGCTDTSASLYPSAFALPFVNSNTNSGEVASDVNGTGTATTSGIGAAFPSLKTPRDLEHFKSLSKINQTFAEANATTTSVEPPPLKAATVDEFLPSDEHVANALARIKRHWHLLENLRQYTLERQRQEQQAQLQLEEEQRRRQQQQQQQQRQQRRDSVASREDEKKTPKMPAPKSTPGTPASKVLSKSPKAYSHSVESPDAESSVDDDDANSSASESVERLESVDTSTTTNATSSPSDCNEIEQDICQILCLDGIDESQVNVQEEVYKSLYQNTRAILDHYHERSMQIYKYMQLLYKAS